MSRDVLVAKLSEGPDPQRAVAMIEEILGELGMGEKQEFVEGDIPPILMGIARYGQRALEAQDVPELREMADGFARMLAPLERLAANERKD